MKTHNELQNTNEWLLLRKEYDTASELPAASGESKYQSRDELLQIKKSGITPEINAATQAIFDKGHAAESDIRQFIEAIIDDELYPTTGSIEIDGLKLLASFDGLTMDGKIVFEHKLYNEKLAQAVKDGNLDLHYTLQLDQQLLVSGAEKAIFVVSDGTPEKMQYMWYTQTTPRNDIVKIWKQFKKDMVAFVQAEKVAPIKTETIQALPALIVNVTGAITTTNIDDFKTTALAFIENINTDLQTDSDFANAEKTIKFCVDAEKQIKSVKQQSVDQMADVSKLFKTMDFIAEELRQTRLMLNKSVGIEKENRKHEIVSNARSLINTLLVSAADRLVGHQITVDENFAGVMKGKRSLDSMQSAVNDETARLKIIISEQEVVIKTNLDAINKLPHEHKNLFPDLDIVIQKENDMVKMIIENRVNKFNDDVKREARRVADEQDAIRENARAKAEQDAKDKAIQVEARKAQAESAANAQQARLEKDKQDAIEAQKAAETRAEMVEKQAKIDAENAVKAACSAERDKIEAEKQAEILAAKNREADKSHKIKINNQAKKSLISAGLSVDAATKAVTAIAKKQVANVVINY